MYVVYVLDMAWVGSDRPFVCVHVCLSVSLSRIVCLRLRLVCVSRLTYLPFLSFAADT